MHVAKQKSRTAFRSRNIRKNYLYVLGIRKVYFMTAVSWKS